MGDSQEHGSPTGWGGYVVANDHLKQPRQARINGCPVPGGLPHACLHILTRVHMYEHTHAHTQIEFLILSCIHFV